MTQPANLEDHPMTLGVEHDGPILRITLNRPEKRNALSRDLLAHLGRAFREAASDETTRLAVVTGAGDRSFAAGGDLRELASVRTTEDARLLSEQARYALDGIRAFPVPVIAALNGDALGGGAELAAACDFRVAAPHARIGFVQGRLAISSAWGGGVDLFDLVGRTAALRLLTTAQVLSVQEARDIGLVDMVADDGETLSGAVERFAAAMLRQPPQVLRAFTALARAHRQGQPRSAMEAIETERFAETWVHDDHWTAAEAILNGERHT